MGPSPHLWFRACKQRLKHQPYWSVWVPDSSVDLCNKAACLPPDLQVYMGPRPRLWLCAPTTVSLAPELLVCMGHVACKNHRWVHGPIETCYSGDKDTVLHVRIHRRGLGPIETCKSGTMNAVLFLQIHSWGLGPIETSGKHAVLNAQIHRWGLGATETCNSCPKVAVLNAQNCRWGLEPIQTYYSCAKLAVMCAQFHRCSLGPVQTC